MTWATRPLVRTAAHRTIPLIWMHWPKTECALPMRTRHPCAPRLKETGYATAIAGKWQLYGNPEQQKRAGQTGALPAEAGFGEHYLWWVEGRAARPRQP